jgi:hypothetical protein
VQVVAVAGGVEEGFGCCDGLEAHPVSDALDGLQDQHASVRGRQRLCLSHRELVLAVADFGVDLLWGNAHLLKGPRQFGGELGRRGQSEAARVGGFVQGAVRPDQVELRLERGQGRQVAFREALDHSPEGASGAPLPGRASVGLRHVAGDHRLAGGER